MLIDIGNLKQFICYSPVVIPLADYRINTTIFIEINIHPA